MHAAVGLALQQQAAAAPHVCMPAAIHHIHSLCYYLPAILHTLYCIYTQVYRHLAAAAGRALVGPAAAAAAANR